MKNFKIPHVFIFLSAIILFAGALTYVVPSGMFDRVVKKTGNTGQTFVVPGTYKEIPKHFSVQGILIGENVESFASPTSLLGLFTAIPKGMNQAAALIFFVLIIGAVVNIIKHTGTIDVFIAMLLKRFSHSPVLLVLILFFTFAFAATFLGMTAEFIPLIPVLLLISKQLGYDRVFGIGILVVGSTVGWATAITNPFNVQVAQSIAELPLGSGMGMRILSFAVCSTMGFFFLMAYGKRVKTNPAKSIMADDPFILDGSISINGAALSKKHVMIALTAFILFAAILFAVQTMGWGLVEMTGGFFTVGLCTILISRMSGDESMKAFVTGLEGMLVPALIVGFARGIQVVMVEGQIIDTILFNTAELLGSMSQSTAVTGIFTFQSLFNFFIPSASGQALVTMPLIVPLSDILGISRQTAVLAFIFGDGFSNSIVPTNGVLMASIAIAGVPYEKWFRFIWPLFLILSFLGGMILIFAHHANY
ncbi:Na+/H+ antiporter NhaC family protein [Lentimicrobium sp.]|uniref:YfcC family protein n=1 Tax=Lentimicrobium sp. TaxID=2034841 RepID=UPI002C87DCF9|nr:Na+/H+ antiporter NhaC family protein [Lentimicrobium sp.]HPR27225.1 Na+/H+ antiporter NhaC family protein [Lentimicrobium sp.]